ncbi:MAG: sialate O-acetylesterase [Chlorobi bacterium]|nr:sialate O-acetylesterase [Chlorobiota bacterium]
MKVRSYILILLLSLAVFTGCTNSFSEISERSKGDSACLRLPAILSDNMVLQRESSANIWGRACPGSRVRVLSSWNNKRYVANVDSEGNWKVNIETGKAGGPYTISIYSDTIIRLKNILLGEVWLCSGQSNMEMPMKGMWNGRVDGSLDDIALSRNPNIRLFTESSRPDTMPRILGHGTWRESTPGTVAKFSAVAWYFGSYLNKVLDVPVGLVVSAVGGSPIQEWMPAGCLKKYKTEDLIKRWQEFDKIKNKPALLSRLYNGKINPLIPFRIKGVIWYQGEANTIDFPYTYDDYFSTMIRSWRDKWGYDLPFYFVQLAPYEYSRSYTGALIRDAQLKVMKNIPNTGMAVTLDIGERNNIHPGNKRDVGKRLAYWALGKTYRIEGIRYTAPVYESYEVKDTSVIINFKCIGEWGIFPMDEDVLYMEIAGKDKLFHPAKARIDWKKRGKSIVVWSPDVKEPVAVRYCFRNWCTGTLTGKNELPVSSFRTDNWKVKIEKIR